MFARMRDFALDPTLVGSSSASIRAMAVQSSPPCVRPLRFLACSPSHVCHWIAASVYPVFDTNHPANTRHGFVSGNRVVGFERRWWGFAKTHRMM
jgi:hypothetical protein